MGFFSSKFHVTARSLGPCASSVLNLPLFFFLLHARGGGFPVQLAWLKCIYPSGTVELYIWELWFLVVEGIIECPVFLDRNRITHWTKDIFRVIYCYTCCQPTLFLFLGGLRTAAYPIALSHPGASYRRCANATIRPPSIAEVKAMKVSRRWSLEIKSNIFGSSWKTHKKHSQFVGFFDAPSEIN